MLVRVRTPKTEPSVSWRRLATTKELMATCHQPGIAEEVDGKIIQHPVGLQTTLEK